MTYYQQGFLVKCAEMHIPVALAKSLLKQAEADPELQRATAIFQDWLTTKKHTVRRGEVLTGIAKKEGVTPQELMEANNLPSITSIRPGQVLKMPNAYAKQKKGQRNGKCC